MRRGLRLLRLRTRPGRDVGAVPTGRRRAQQRQIHHPARGVLGPDAGRLDSRFHLGDFARDQFLGRGAQVGAPPHLPFLQARQLDLRQQHDDDVGLPGRYRVGQVPPGGDVHRATDGMQDDPVSRGQQLGCADPGNHLELDAQRGRQRRHDPHDRVVQGRVPPHQECRRPAPLAQHVGVGGDPRLVPRPHGAGVIGRIGSVALGIAHLDDLEAKRRRDGLPDREKGVVTRLPGCDHVVGRRQRGGCLGGEVLGPHAEADDPDRAQRRRGLRYWGLRRSRWVTQACRSGRCRVLGAGNRSPRRWKAQSSAVGGPVLGGGRGHASSSRSPSTSR